ncbi:hypothetical protein GCM10010372_55580 [Streptomyces tauricus]|jgi:large subunit ribosomal protein L21|nr:hypothetical protein GCM10010372_55580 [Streptomyces tauricus]
MHRIPVNLFLLVARAPGEAACFAFFGGWTAGIPISSEREIRVYAIVRSGGRQHKVAVGDIVEVDKISTAKVGDTVELSTLLVVDGDAVTSDPWVLAGIKVQAEIVDHHKGVKIDILRYKNKTGYRRRQGHRQQYTAIKVTEIPAAAK